MRKYIQNYLESNDKVILLHNDIWPYKHERIIDLGLSEFLTIQYAYGLTLQSYKVLIYSVSGFVLNKILYFVNDYDIKNITFLNAGAGFTYYPSSIAHYNYNDIQIARLMNMQIYVAYKTEQLNNILSSSTFNYVRLGFDHYESLKSNIKIFNKVPIITYGWLYYYLNKIFSNVIGIVDLNIQYDYSGIVVEDHFKTGGLLENIKNSKAWIGIEEKKEYSYKEFLNYVVKEIQQFWI
jgi:hypothetical protein